MNSEVLRIAKELLADDVKLLAETPKGKIYEVVHNEDIIIGVPVFIIETANKVRTSTNDESFKLMSIFFKDNDESE